MAITVIDNETLDPNNVQPSTVGKQDQIIAKVNELLLLLAGDIKIDIAEVDVQELITGIANGKTLNDVNTTLGSQATAANQASQLSAEQAVQAAVERDTADKTSTLYDGGGADNAMQLEADSAAVVAGGAAVIDANLSTAIDVQMVNAAAGESCTLLVTEYSNGTPTVINQIRQVEVSIPTTDLAAEVDLQMVGLATAVGYAKAPVRVSVTPGAYVMLSLAAESAAGAKYLRYQLR